MKIPFDPCDSTYIEKIEKRLSYTELVDEYSIPEPDDIVIMGTYSRSWRNKRKREVLAYKAVKFEGRIDSPTAHVRDYVSFCYGRKPAKKEQRDILKSKHMPLYAEPGIMRDAVYVDIRSAWYSIVLLCGWNVEYFPNRWYGRGEPPVDFPFYDNKVARSAMVSIGRSSMLPVWTKGKLKMVKMYNGTENYHVWGVISDVLNSIAVKAISMGARYVNTDGFIISRSHSKELMDYISGWFLETRIKGEGAAIISGPGAYSIGAHHSARSMSFHPIDTVDRTVDQDWLQKRLVKIVSKST